mmetsp:Transcript_21768/g.42831  ORF Transcript_21768/g.42831 Transcript_21768/m.42831 type:complete len:200 (-) Transcript_21768:2475-3074(-)
MFCKLHLNCLELLTLSLLFTFYCFLLLKHGKCFFFHVLNFGFQFFDTLFVGLHLCLSFFHCRLCLLRLRLRSLYFALGLHVSLTVGLDVLLNLCKTVTKRLFLWTTKLGNFLVQCGGFLFEGSKVGMRLVKDLLQAFSLRFELRKTFAFFLGKLTAWFELSDTFMKNLLLLGKLLDLKPHFGDHAVEFADELLKSHALL